jgi:hypothetical protein
MRINILVIILIFILVLPSFSQTGKQPGKEDASDLPQISFTETDYDFGIIEYGRNAVHYFLFSNTGKVPLVISNVRTSCGCTVPEWPNAPIRTGAQDSLKVEYNTKVKGGFNKTITVHSNAVNAMVELRIRGNVMKAK